MADRITRFDIADQLHGDDDVQAFLDETAQHGDASDFIHALGIAARARHDNSRQASRLDPRQSLKVAGRQWQSRVRDGAQGDARAGAAAACGDRRLKSSRTRQRVLVFTRRNPRHGFRTWPLAATDRDS